LEGGERDCGACEGSKGDRVYICPGCVVD
jgi:hypothetical protein